MGSPPPDYDSPLGLDLEIPPVDCTVVLHHRRSDATLEVSGEVDITTVHTLAHALEATADNGVRRLVVDLDGVGFIGATGLNALVSAHAAHRDAGKDLHVSTTRASTLRLFTATGLDHLLLPA
jgi:anti-sigma B factor antagonist